jgi:sugar phosphate isomerase/epimerase
MFHIGATSYVIPADILPNVQFLAGRVDDVQLVLFETDEYGSNLPDAAQCARLNAIAAATGLTYTVHLPLDLHLGDGGDASHISLVKAHRVIEATRPLAPYAYTLHLDGRALVPPICSSDGSQESSMAEHAHMDESATLERWQENARRALEIVCTWLDEPQRLCVENLERWEPAAFAPIIEALPVSRTIDIGHLWLQGADPLVHLRQWMHRTRVIHLHGIAQRDHASLAHAPAEKLDPIVAFLAKHFRGVLTVEVFNQADLESSLDALAASLKRSALQENSL